MKDKINKFFDGLVISGDSVVLFYIACFGLFIFAETMLHEEDNAIYLVAMPIYILLFSIFFFKVANRSSNKIQEFDTKIKELKAKVKELEEEQAKIEKLKIKNYILEAEKRVLNAKLKDLEEKQAKP